MRSVAAGALALTLCAAAFGAQGARAGDDPWRLGTALGEPSWLSLSGTYRLRYETLDGAVKAGATGSDQVLAERTLLAARATGSHFYAGLEAEDSRIFLADKGSSVSTSDVDALELLQAYVGWKSSDVFAPGDQLDLTAGRMTIDVGSRRLVARNDFRNTINSFTGVEARWKSAAGTRVQTFFVMPIDRRPKDRQALLDAQIANDVENPHVVFWGADLARDKLFGKATGEVYFFGLDESDRPEVATANRRLYTPGVRISLSPSKNAWDYEIEAAYQFGTSHATTSPSDTKTLDNSAEFIHASLGRSLATAWPVRLVAQYDYASGDSNPNDGDNNRFDTLYGARRFDFGPTGIYGPIQRANISTPGARIEVKPNARLDGFVGYRAFWLASDTDTMTGTGVHDATGAAGSFVGQQIEARVRVAVLPKNVDLELGGAYLIDGGFLKHAPNATREGNTSYFYSQFVLTF